MSSSRRCFQPGAPPSELQPCGWTGPSWRVRDDHEADEVRPDSPPIHYGPEFGPFDVTAAADGVLKAYVATTDLRALPVEDGPDGLREVAAHAIAAAAWLEAQR